MEAGAPTLALATVPTLLSFEFIQTTTSFAESATSATPVHFESASWLSLLLQHLPSWQPTFMHGFILGQVSMLILLFMAIKYILFEEPFSKRDVAGDEAPVTPSSAATGGAAARKDTVMHEGGFGLSKFMIFSRKPKEQPPSDLAEELAKMHKEILARTGYDLLNRGPETCDWLTVFLAQIIAKFRTDAERHDRLVRVISEALNGELRPSIIDNIRITQFSLGSDFLRIVSARMVPSSGSLGMRTELDLALHDEITLGFDTRVLVNWPRTTVAALPVSMVVSLVKFVGTVVVEFDCDSLEPALRISILPDYVLEFDVQTLIGSKAKVQNLPMLTSVIIRKLEAAFAKELVKPNEKHIKIKHPFTPKSAASGPAPSSPQAQVMSAREPLSAQLPSQHVKTPQESHRPASPIGPIVAELPPDYNTQLPPPHPLRSNTNSRATAASPLLGHPPRMFTPEEPAATNRHQSGGMAPPLQQQQQQHARSPEPSLFSMSPRLQPIVGISSGSTLGPSFANSRISSSGGRHASLHTQPAADKQQPDTSDDMQVKDSVRQRLNRVIRTVNES
ncbi:ERMES complex subunit mmm1 [Coemansia sp. RSA 1086]|nr:ERMES complex subunit mmm1 [Coemansia sp. RSA 1086]